MIRLFSSKKNPILTYFTTILTVNIDPSSLPWKVKQIMSSPSLMLKSNVIPPPFQPLFSVNQLFLDWEPVFSVFAAVLSKVTACKPFYTARTTFVPLPQPSVKKSPFSAVSSTTMVSLIPFSIHSLKHSYPRNLIFSKPS